MKSIEMKSIDKKTLSKQVIDEIIELLNNQTFQPGDRLPSEMDLMERFNVSRPVIREALTSLEAIGIVNRKARHGTYFENQIGSKPFSIMLALSSGNIHSIIETRISLEVGLITLAAEKITEDELAQLAANIEDMKAREDNEYRELDKEFHKIIARSASNQLIEAFMTPLLNLFDQTWGNIPREYRNQAKTVNQHVAIYEALKENNASKAYEAMYTHLDTVRKRFIQIEEDRKG